MQIQLEYKMELRSCILRTELIACPRSFMLKLKCLLGLAPVFSQDNYIIIFTQGSCPYNENQFHPT